MRSINHVTRTVVDIAGDGHADNAANGLEDSGAGGQRLVAGRQRESTAAVTAAAAAGDERSRLSRAAADNARLAADERGHTKSQLARESGVLAVLAVLQSTRGGGSSGSSAATWAASLARKSTGQRRCGVARLAATATSAGDAASGAVGGSSTRQPRLRTPEDGQQRSRQRSLGRHQLRRHSAYNILLQCFVWYKNEFFMHT